MKIAWSEPSDPTAWGIPPRRIAGMTLIMEVPKRLGEVVSLTVTDGGVTAQTASGATILIPHERGKPS